MQELLNYGRPESRERLLSLKNVALIIPLVVLWLTPTLYFAGLIYDNEMLAHYGLMELQLDKTTQQTIAQGFSNAVVGASSQIKAFLTIGYLVLIVISAAIGTALAWPLSRGTLELSKKRVGMVYRAMALIAIIPALMVAILLPASSATFAARARIDAIDHALNSGCERCTVYRTRTGDLRGFAVAGSKDRIVIAQRGDVQIVKLDDLLATVGKDTKIPGGRKPAG